MNGWVIPLSLPGTLRFRSARSRERLLLSLAFSRAFRSGGWSISDLAFLMWAAACAMAALSPLPHEEKLKLWNHFQSSWKTRLISKGKKSPPDQVILFYCPRSKWWQDDEDEKRTEAALMPSSPLIHQLTLPMQRVWVYIAKLPACRLDNSIWDQDRKSGGVG